jgi:hypothetical protein
MVAKREKRGTPGVESGGSSGSEIQKTVRLSSGELEKVVPPNDAFSE